MCLGRPAAGGKGTVEVRRALRAALAGKALPLPCIAWQGQRIEYLKSQLNVSQLNRGRGKVEGGWGSGVTCHCEAAAEDHECAYAAAAVVVFCALPYQPQRGCGHLDMCTARWGGTGSRGKARRQWGSGPWQSRNAVPAAPCPLLILHSFIASPQGRYHALHTHTHTQTRG